MIEFLKCKNAPIEKGDIQHAMILRPSQLNSWSPLYFQPATSKDPHIPLRSTYEQQTWLESNEHSHYRHVVDFHMFECSRVN
jgi:hypothetical protein